MTTFIGIILAAALANNLVLVQLLGVSSLFAFSNRLQAATELALFTSAVMLGSSLCNLLLQRFLLQPLGLEFLQLICFIGVTAWLSHQLRIWVKRHYPHTLRRQELAFTLVGANSAVIGLAWLNSSAELTLIHAMASSLGATAGFAFLLLAFAALRQRLDLADIPAPFRGAPSYLISAGIVAMCLLGFAEAAPT